MVRLLVCMLVSSSGVICSTSAFLASPLPSLVVRHVVGTSNQHIKISPSIVTSCADLHHRWNVASLPSPHLSATKHNAYDDTAVVGKSDGRNSIVTTEMVPSPPSKIRQLKDRMWVREAIEDLTASEFASSLDAATEAKQLQDAAVPSKDKRKRAVDFENLLTKLDRLVEEMCVETDFDAMSRDDLEGKSCYTLEDETSPTEGGVRKRKNRKCFMLKDGYGMGSMVYTHEQREALLVRIMASRKKLIKAMGGDVEQAGEDEATDLDQIRVQLQDELAEKDENLVTIEPTKKPAREKKLGNLDLYVRDDGTVDWDGALQDRAALKKFGSAVWARINGEDPEKFTESNDEVSETNKETEAKAVTAKIVETDALREKKAMLDSLRAEFEKMDANHTALLNSAISAGTAVATLNLATLKPATRNEIRVSYDLLNKKKEEVSLQMLNYELERIFTYFESEMGNTKTKGYIPLQDRLNVAEFGMLESQMNALNEQRKSGDIVDADVLAVVIDQVMDFKRRLGIDYYVTGLTYDKEAIQQWLKDLLAKSRTGVAFYVKGCKLFWNDVVFCFSLISRALQGYTLKPREVRTLRRTFKDVITFIPVIIILLIPLSPVGHVLVFGAIQRVFPDFFPSCFTEARQNLLELYESTEYTEVTINETWEEKLSRASEAAVFVMSEGARRLYENIFIPSKAAAEERNDNSSDK